MQNYIVTCGLWYLQRGWCRFRPSSKLLHGVKKLGGIWHVIFSCCHQLCCRAWFSFMWHPSTSQVNAGCLQGWSCAETSVGSLSSGRDYRYVWVQVSELFFIFAWGGREDWSQGVHLIELRGTKGQLWYHGFWQGEELKRIMVTWSCHTVCFNSDFVWQAGRGKKKSIFYSRWQILYGSVLPTISKAWNQHLTVQPLSWNQTFWRKVHFLWRKRGKCNFPF